VERPIRIVTAGVDADSNALLVTEAGGDRVEVASAGDLQGARLLRSGIVDYYLGTCWSGGGGALAAATALLGAERVAIVATPGMSVDLSRVESYLGEGRRAFGFPYEQSKAAISTIVQAILAAHTDGPRSHAAGPVPSASVASDEHGPFQERFDLLEAGGELDPDVRPLVELFLGAIATTFAIVVDETTAPQFATHLATAFTRIRAGDQDLEPSAVVAAEISDRSAEVQFVTEAARRGETVLGRTVPQAEIEYMTIHVCALIDSQNRG